MAGTLPKTDVHAAHVATADEKDGGHPRSCHECANSDGSIRAFVCHSWTAAVNAFPALTSYSRRDNLLSVMTVAVEFFPDQEG